MSEEDFTEDVTNALATAHSDFRAWEDLLKNPQFAKLVKVLQEQADSAQVAIYARPLPSMDAVLEQEWNKGRLTGLLALTVTIEGLMEDLQMTIEQLEVEKHGRTK